LALAKIIYKEIKSLALKFENLPLGSPHISINWDRAITIDDEVFYPADLEDEINE
jgi:hypothetical protein